ncbi:MAG: hypothetical protein NE330_16075 [Lentisphaeraceae bacterium]|nr:hypothetical protein [Lentisphaeraceae bacterium]
MSLKKLGLLAIIFLLASCATPSHQHLYNETMFTNVGFHFEKGRHLTTNYLVGTYVPAGSEVKVISVKGDVLTILYKGQSVNISNVPKFSGLNTDGMVNRYLSKGKVSGTSHRAATVGMTKSEVIKAIGYPPSHVTPSTDESTWVYWKNRFNRMKVVFENGKVSKLID